MTLEGSHYIRGHFYDSDGNAVEDAMITVQSHTEFHGVASAQTTSTGYYQINVQDICSEGDLVIVTFTSGSDTIEESIVVDLDELTQEVSATLQNQFQLTTSSYNLYLPLPRISGAERTYNKSLRLFNFWSDNLDVDDVEKESEPLVLNGFFFVDVYTRETIAGKVDVINDIMNNNQEITISGIHDEIDGVYIISSFSFNTMKGSPNGFTWSLSLEYVRD